jgi:hypothetical protein
MILVFSIMFIVVVLISISWTNGIDETIKFQKENPDADLSEGWLDWDLKNNKQK